MAAVGRREIEKLRNASPISVPQTRARDAFQFWGELVPSARKPDPFDARFAKRQRQAPIFASIAESMLTQSGPQNEGSWA